MRSSFCHTTCLGMCENRMEASSFDKCSHGIQSENIETFEILTPKPKQNPRRRVAQHGIRPLPLQLTEHRHSI